LPKEVEDLDDFRDDAAVDANELGNNAVRFPQQVSDAFNERSPEWHGLQKSDPFNSPDDRVRPSIRS
jgi:hypothetical protein